MSASTTQRWHRRGGGAALGMLAVAILAVGLGSGRADVGLLGLPLAATAAVTLRRPVGAASAAITLTAEDDAVVAEVRVDGATGTELVVVQAAAYEEPPTTVVVSPAARPRSPRGSPSCTAARRRCCVSADRWSPPVATSPSTSIRASPGPRSCRRGSGRSPSCCRTA